MTEIGLILLVVFALYGVIVNLLTIPDIGRFFGFASDGSIPKDARLYAGSMGVRSTLRVVAKLTMLLIGLLVVARMRMLIPPIGDTLILLAVLAIAALDVESTINLAETHRIRKRIGILQEDWEAFLQDLHSTGGQHRGS